MVFVYFFSRLKKLVVKVDYCFFFGGGEGGSTVFFCGGFMWICAMELGF